LPFRRPSQFPRTSLVAARLACRFAGEPWTPELIRRVYTANFAEDRDISDAAVVETILAQMGQASGLLAEAESREAKAALRAETDRAAALGIFGAPTFVVGDELFWGNDRLETAMERARRETGAGRG
jgi:2-hydroxychromene-2-carboxylate isomerase